MSQESTEYNEQLPEPLQPNDASDKFDEQFTSLIDQFHKMCEEKKFTALIIINVDGEILSKKMGHRYDTAALAAAYLRAEKHAINRELDAS